MIFFVHHATDLPYLRETVHELAKCLIARLVTVCPPHAHWPPPQQLDWGSISALLMGIHLLSDSQWTSNSLICDGDVCAILARLIVYAVFLPFPFLFDSSDLHFRQHEQVGRSRGQWINYNILHIFFQLSKLCRENVTTMIYDAIYSADAIGVIGCLAHVDAKWQYEWMATSVRTNIGLLTDPIRLTTYESQKAKDR
jgi:hypothetical protein